MTDKEYLDAVATAAMQSLILKIPLHDRKGEHGVRTPEIDDIQQVRRDVAESAYDYAVAMLERSKINTALAAGKGE